MNLSEAIKYGQANYSSLPPALQKSYDFINKVTKDGSDMESYKESEVIKNTIDLAVTKFNELSAKEKPEPKKQVTDEPKAKFKVGQTVYTNWYGTGPVAVTIKSIFKRSKGMVIPGSGASKPLVTFSYLLTNGDTIEESYLTDVKPKESEKPSKKTPETKTKVKKSDKSVQKKEIVTKPMASNQVEHLPDEIKIMKRYIGLNGKEKTPAQVMNLLDALQKAIIEKRIRKTSPYSAEIDEIQKRLIRAYKTIKGHHSLEVKIEAEFFNKINAIVIEYEALKSVALIKRYINLDGEKQTKEKAEKLLDQINKFLHGNPNDKYSENLTVIAKNLGKYIHGDTKELHIEEQALNGLGLPWAKIARAALMTAKAAKDITIKAYNKVKPHAQQMVTKVKKSINDHSKKKSNKSAAVKKSEIELRIYKDGKLHDSLLFYNMQSANKAESDYKRLGYKTKLYPATNSSLGNVNNEDMILNNAPKQKDPMENIFVSGTESKPTRQIKTFRLFSDLGLFLGDLEQNELGITIESDPGAGKTQLAYQLANGFLDLDKEVAMLCYELPHDSAPMKKYEKLYLSPINQEKIKYKSDMPKGLDFIRQIAGSLDVIIIDSWNRLGVKNKEYDDLRKEFPNTIFVLLLRHISSGEIKGGNDPAYDSGININIKKVDDTFSNNYACTSKNRYGQSGLKYNIASQKLIR